MITTTRKIRLCTIYHHPLNMRARVQFQRLYCIGILCVRVFSMLECVGFGKESENLSIEWYGNMGGGGMGC